MPRHERMRRIDSLGAQDVQAHRRFQEEVKSFERNPDEWKRTHKYDDDRKRYRYDGDDDYDDDDKYRRRKRRGGFDLFDIFD